MNKQEFLKELELIFDFQSPFERISPCFRDCDSRMKVPLLSFRRS